MSLPPKLRLKVWIAGRLEVDRVVVRAGGEAERAMLAAADITRLAAKTGSIWVLELTDSVTGEMRERLSNDPAQVASPTKVSVAYGGAFRDDS